ncbi:lysine biosynthesis protein LysW [Microbispora triticiradicis]|uniref:lysine biosynthesis protein LysW n=1 Tax=Microbispora triticiradicis TaxID=2200763 RepID=UPI001FCBE6A1|nr:lysine biosynthesis protein LysW [Microbispora triticiradicis]MBO4270537.1 lysine biosynthesis protein LysW [Microbispora triticiradicis]
MTVAVSTCPDCTEVVPTSSDLRVTSIVVCPACQAELEVIGLDPAEFALAPEIEEDFGE